MLAGVAAAGGSRWPSHGPEDEDESGGRALLCATTMGLPHKAQGSVVSPPHPAS